MKISNFFKLIIAIAICEIVGIGGAFFTSPVVSSTWYRALEKPSFNPPSWVFSPVWITLYVLMGLSVWLIWRQLDSRWSLSRTLIRGGNNRKVKLALGIFGVQLFLNAIWSIIFFGLRGSTWLTINNIGWALVDIVLLWFAIVWTIVVFYKISKPAAYLLLPYILWVSFAIYLNYSIWILN